MRLNHVALVCSSEQNADVFYKDVLELRKMKSFVPSNDLARQIFGIDREYHVVVYGDDHFKAEVFIDEYPPERYTSVEHVCLEVKPPRPPGRGFATLAYAPGMEVSSTLRLAVPQGG